MTRPALLTAASILTALSAMVAVKSFVPVATVMRAAGPAPARVAASAPAVEMMAIVPAPVIDTTAAVFVGTGDASGGGWVQR